MFFSHSLLIWNWKCKSSFLPLLVWSLLGHEQFVYYSVKHFYHRKLFSFDTLLGYKHEEPLNPCAFKTYFENIPIHISCKTQRSFIQFSLDNNISQNQTVSQLGCWRWQNPKLVYRSSCFMCMYECVCVCVCLVLCNFTACVGLCNHHHSQDTEQPGMVLFMVTLPEA